MRDRDLYAQILGISAPWQVTEVNLKLDQGEVVVNVDYTSGAAHVCPKCGSSGPGYDSRKRRWRHLNTCQLRTVLEADVPRMTCPEHGVIMIHIPWAEPGSRYTALFEAFVIDWLKDATVSAVAKQMWLSWPAIANIQRRAVERGLARREKTPAEHIGVDETSFRKRHDYVTVVSDTTSGTVLFVGQDRRTDTLTNWFESLSDESISAIKSVSMDMWAPYINATLGLVPEADKKICFDRFHVAKKVGEAVDKVRRQENRTLMSEGNKDLVGTKYQWLKNSANMSNREWIMFEQLREGAYKTARAWAIKELAASIWHYKSRTWAAKAWDKWYSWAIRSRLEPIKEVARTVKRHLWGIVNAVVLNITNGPAESINSRIKAIKVKSRGFRNKQRFADAIYFHLGGLDLYPEGVR